MTRCDGAAARALRLRLPPFEDDGSLHSEAVAAMAGVGLATRCEGAIGERSSTQDAGALPSCLGMDRGQVPGLAAFSCLLQVVAERRSANTARRAAFCSALATRRAAVRWRGRSCSSKSRMARSTACAKSSGEAVSVRHWK